MDFQLSQENFKELRKIQKKTNLHPRRYKKVTVLIMLHQKHSVSVIEAALGLDDNTIRRYVKGYEKRGLDNYLKDGYIPFSGRLNNEQEKKLTEHLDNNLYTTVASICAYVRAEYDESYSVSGMTDLLHRLGFSYKKTKAVPSKADEAAQVAFLEQTLPPLLEEARSGTAAVYFADGCHPTHNTKTSRGWILKGKDFELDCNSGRQRVNINGAVNALKPEHLVYETTDSINAQSTQRICRKLLKKHPGITIYFICDNARYNRNRMLQEWAINQRIEFIFLPPYSPNLNLIERLWLLMKIKAINSTYYEKHIEFRNGIVDFLSNTKKYKTEIRSMLTLNFRTVEGTSVYGQTNS
jgi:transposase